MSLFGDEDESDSTTESDDWDVDEDRRSSSASQNSPISGDVDEDGGSSAEPEHPDPSVDGDDEGEGDPLADLDTVTLYDGEPSGTVKRAVDPEAGVVIYAYKNGRAGGLSTVPVAETDLVDGE